MGRIGAPGAGPVYPRDPVRRGRVGARRLLALLIYAQSADILVPTWVIRRLYEEVYGQ